MRSRALLAVILGALIEAGCLVRIEHVSNPAAAFDEARAEAMRHQGRPGPAHTVNVLVYDPGDHELVQVSVPMWLCRKLQGRADFDDEREERTARAVKRHVRLEDLERAGLGILVEVEEDGGERVLVWLR